MLDAAERMIRVARLPLCIQPNAGVPVNVEGRNIYQTTPKYMAKYAKRMIQSGVRIVGGCCGTTPAHIREIRNEIKALAPGRPRESVRVTAPAQERAPGPAGEEERAGPRGSPAGISSPAWSWSRPRAST